MTQLFDELKNGFTWRRFPWSRFRLWLTSLTGRNPIVRGETGTWGGIRFVEANDKQPSASEAAGRPGAIE